MVLDILGVLPASMTARSGLFVLRTMECELINRQLGGNYELGLRITAAQITPKDLILARIHVGKLSCTW